MFVRQNVLALTSASLVLTITTQFLEMLVLSVIVTLDLVIHIMTDGFY